MSEWISVKERVPKGGEEGEDVLIAYKRVCEKCNHEEDDMSYITVGYYICNKWLLGEPLSDDVFTDKHDGQILVTHWMPLPEAPE